MLHATTIRLATSDDEPFLWQMLVLAASMSGDADDVERAKADPDLRCYVDGFGREGDLGFIAQRDGTAVGAAWVRLLVGPPHPAKVWTHEEPELAIATVAGERGRGVGSLLLTALLERATGHYPAIVLSVREGSAAVPLYERFGFVTEQRIVNRVGTTSLTMRRTLR